MERYKLFSAVVYFETGRIRTPHSDANCCRVPECPEHSAPGVRMAAVNCCRLSGTASFRSMDYGLCRLAAQTLCPVRRGVMSLDYSVCMVRSTVRRLARA